MATHMEKRNEEVVLCAMVKFPGLYEKARNFAWTLGKSSFQRKWIPTNHLLSLWLISFIL